jgi:hypothetical protein
MGRAYFSPFLFLLSTTTQSKQLDTGEISPGRVAYFLENGFKNVASMSGGFEAWRQVYDHEAE